MRAKIARIAEWVVIIIFNSLLFLALWWLLAETGMTLVPHGSQQVTIREPAPPVEPGIEIRNNSDGTLFMGVAQTPHRERLRLRPGDQFWVSAVLLSEWCVAPERVDGPH